VGTVDAMTTTTHYPRKFFRERPSQQTPFYGPVMARTVIEDWGQAWCVTPYPGAVHEAEKYQCLNKVHYVEVYWSPTTGRWEEVA
jgi:hypothetical protein